MDRPESAVGRIGLETCGPFHAEVLAALHARSFAEPWDAEAMERLLVSPGIFGILALDEARPVGLILCRSAADECEILTLAVDTPVRGSGIGGRLLDAAVGAARQRGADSLFLEVGAENRAARRLYASRGFHQIGRRRNYYRIPGRPAEDALVLCLQGETAG